MANRSSSCNAIKLRSKIIWWSWLVEWVKTFFIQPTSIGLYPSGPHDLDYIFTVWSQLIGEYCPIISQVLTCIFIVRDGHAAGKLENMAIWTLSCTLSNLAHIGMINVHYLFIYCFFYMTWIQAQGIVASIVPWVLDTPIVFNRCPIWVKPNLVHLRPAPSLPHFLSPSFFKLFSSST